jgi:hypothetical protein
MATPRRARVCERYFLNLPGFYRSAFIVAYVEDTAGRGPETCEYCDSDCETGPCNFEPRPILQIADCSDRIELEFDLDSEAGRANSLHKLDTLISALRVFRAGIVEEIDEYDRRERELEQLRSE